MSYVNGDFGLLEDLFKVIGNPWDDHRPCPCLKMTRVEVKMQTAEYCLVIVFTPVMGKVL